MDTERRDRILWLLQRNYKPRILLPSELAEFCERGFEAVGDERQHHLDMRIPAQSLVCALFRFDHLFNQMHDETQYSEGGQIFVFSPDAEPEYVPGLVLSRAEGKWRAWPHVKDFTEINTNGRRFLVMSEWISVLHEIAVSEYISALHYNEKLLPHRWDFTMDLYAREYSFRFGLRAALFRTPAEFLAWNTALFWDEWEKKSVSQHDRLRQLHNATGFEVTASILDSLNPTTVIRSLHRPLSISTNRRGDACTRHDGLEIAGEMSGRPLMVEEVEENGYKEYYPVQSEADLFFSFGGPPELSFDYREATDLPCLLGPYSDDAVVRERLWWWRQLPEWPPTAAKIFFDNFESSSFNYELAARCIYGRQWEPFNMPWVKLSNFKRGMLNTMWPTKRYGRYTFMWEHSLEEFKEGADLVLIPVDVRVPQADVLSMVAEIHRRERLRRNLPEPGGRRKKEESSPWDVIELLDRKDLLGQYINPSETRLINAVVKRLYDDCERLGIQVRE